MTTEFNETLREYYTDHGRHDLPWRLTESDGQFDPYKILVSELMLQQTQVSRVIPKFHEFLMKFPTAAALAAAPLADVLVAWSGLGYNRRAKFLWQAAQMVTNDMAGRFPTTLAELVMLPGVGKNTAGAILAYAFNQPAIFIETNVRTVYIHHFFKDETAVPDAAIIEVLQTTIDHEDPREFYWSLMDYGTFLKQTVGNLSKFGSGYSKQSKFEGSQRQIRGQVLKLLADSPKTTSQISNFIKDDRLPSVLQDLINEKLIIQQGDQYSL